MARNVALRRAQPRFAHARSPRNALDRARLRPANRLFETREGPLDASDLGTIAADLQASGAVRGGLDAEGGNA